MTRLKGEQQLDRLQGAGKTRGTGLREWACLLNAGQQERLHAGESGLGRNAGDVTEESGACLPVAIVQECDHCWQQEVITQPASRHNSEQIPLPNIISSAGTPSQGDELLSSSASDM